MNNALEKFIFGITLLFLIVAARGASTLDRLPPDSRQASLLLEQNSESRTPEMGRIFEQSSLVEKDVLRDLSQKLVTDARGISSTTIGAEFNHRLDNIPSPEGGEFSSYPGVQLAHAEIATIATDEDVFERIKATGLPKFVGAGAIVADLETGQTYFQVNISRRWPMASLTKLMTAVLTIDKIDFGKPVTLRTQDFTNPDVALSKTLRAGETYTVRDLLWSMLIFSSNEAAEALANAYGYEDFIKELNDLVVGWGMTSTYFTDPTGLMPANQSTVEDLLRATQIIYETHPEVFAITSQPSFSIVEQTSGKSETIKNINFFAGRPEFLGGKTGYTDEAGGNLISLFLHEKRPVLVIVLGTEDRFVETERLWNWFRTSFQLRA